MSSDIYVTSYEDIIPFDMVVAIGEKGTVLATVTTPDGKVDEALHPYHDRFDEHFPEGWSLQWVPPERREDHTDFQIALGLHQEKVNRKEEANLCDYPLQRTLKTAPSFNAE